MLQVNYFPEDIFQFNLFYLIYICEEYYNIYFIKQFNYKIKINYITQ